MDDVTDAVVRGFGGVLDDAEIRVLVRRDVRVVAVLIGAALSVIDAGGVEVVAGIDVSLRNGVVRGAVEMGAGRKRRAVGRDVHRPAAFGSVTVTEASVVLPVLVAVIV